MEGDLGLRLLPLERGDKDGRNAEGGRSVFGLTRRLLFDDGGGGGIDEGGRGGADKVLDSPVSCDTDFAMPPTKGRLLSRGINGDASLTRGEAMERAGRPSCIGISDDSWTESICPWESNE